MAEENKYKKGAYGPPKTIKEKNNYMETILFVKGDALTAHIFVVVIWLNRLGTTCLLDLKKNYTLSLFFNGSLKLSIDPH